MAMRDAVCLGLPHADRPGKSARAYFQSMARTAIAAAWRSVRSSVNCSTVTSDSRAGDRPGGPGLQTNLRPRAVRVLDAPIPARSTGRVSGKQFACAGAVPLGLPHAFHDPSAACPLLADGAKHSPVPGSAAAEAMDAAR